MKKLSLIAAGVLGVAGLCADESKSSWLSNVSLDSSVGFQSEHIVRGRFAGRQCFAPSVELGYRALDSLGLYIGTDAWVLTKAYMWNEVAPYVGLSYDVTDMFAIDAGYIHHFYTNAPAQNGATGGPSHLARNSSEIYMGVLADTLMRPSIYGYYDFARREMAFEGRVGHSFDFSQYSLSGLGIDLGAKLGFDRAKKPLGMPYDSGIHGKKRYCYYGVSADLVYAFNSNAKAKVGVSYEGGSYKKTDWPMTLGGGRKNSVWVNASVDCSF